MVDSPAEDTLDLGNDSSQYATKKLLEYFKGVRNGKKRVSEETFCKAALTFLEAAWPSQA